jgi:hypothetical protein
LFGKIVLLLITVLPVLCLPSQTNAQIGGGNISGNMQIDVQYYSEDSAINAPAVPEKILTNGFANVIYTSGNFSAGLRYESYLNPLLGFDPRYRGSGIMYRYASYNYEGLDVTAGSFYEQFGNGLIFRSYEERGLGFDNAIDGIRLKYSPLTGLYLKGFIGRQRSFFDYGPGIIRGFDAEIAFNETFSKLSKSKTSYILGGSMISKYQADQDPIYKLPENVAAFAGRFNITRSGINLIAEYAQKINDPSVSNEFIYKNGEALLLSASYSIKGFGIIISAKRIDNMDFRSDRNSIGNNLLLNFLPALTKQHTYSLASLYPYATQPNGEMGFQAELFNRYRPGTTLGGKYGTNISINYSRANSLDTLNINDPRGYSSEFLSVGNEIYFQDINIEINKKISEKVKLIVNYINLIYNKAVIEKPGEPTVYAHVGIADITYSFTRQKSIRTELQHLFTEQDKGSWAMLLAEYSVAPNWYITAFDEYNYGNDDEKKRLHYFTGSMTYVKRANRFSLSYGRQREGIFCVGGICRTVPASNGFLFSVTSSF